MGESGSMLVYIFIYALCKSYLVPLNTPNTIYIEESALEDPSFNLIAGLPNSPIFRIQYCTNKVLQFFKNNYTFFISINFNENIQYTSNYGLMDQIDC